MTEQEKIEGYNYIEKGSIQETMLGPLWVRATRYKDFPGILDDPKARKVLSKIKHDFTGAEEVFGEFRGIGVLVRAKSLDDAVRDYIEEHPEATIVNIAAGLETSFSRVDNGKIKWYNLDLPESIEFRKKIIPDTSRCKCIAQSVFEYSWMDEIEYSSNKGIFFIAGGFVYYFTESEISNLMKELANRFPRGGITFDAVNKFGAKVINKKLKKYGIDSSFSFVIGKPEKIIPSWSNEIKIKSWHTLYAHTKLDLNWNKTTIKMIRMSERLKIAKIITLEFVK
jgi:O-methyltransferase involved in polyketide biosynthesis